MYIGTWIVASFSYYLAYFFLKYLEGEVFINSIVAALSEMTSYMLTGVLFDKLGIKRSYLTYFLLSAFGATLYYSFAHLHRSLVPILLLLTMYGVSASCMTNWLTNARLFPVIYASSTFGIASFFARLSNILAP